jgi:hypothetical protein
MQQSFQNTKAKWHMKVDCDFSMTSVTEAIRINHPIYLSYPALTSMLRDARLSRGTLTELGQ